ncbi:hypothetical protein A2276_04005 [candidate division WOR-1 bacterium RIFOXYA12_FULL_43_27]|uniref:Uncharacterized protein n=1 Tax=candidate division WOR-1 bacterium RIFOXYC2_FULL_46_14 TaxID=1802587 RepID=A0A1F4U6Z8_UNCSA|nr:MAG: hypothetical protein A2276_04005 [candidate division WOR-1 bacterium RIFOXYA12_FULL_43_27]OGC19146.1 MAG: hypothetical protein A2292_00330 [candidate division WOR-1 bacterium RIFOXYB2_FULL_46_45]OGC40736.1 MAG: hypothetical protein A2438_00335 [candidate division WOR-1 bacterium RIFOXYC2_FULL_46_14]
MDRFDILDRADGKADGKISTPLSNINPGEAISFLDLLGGHNIRGVKIICFDPEEAPQVQNLLRASPYKWNDAQIDSLIKFTIRAAGEYASSALYALPAMLQTGITAPDKIKALIKTVVSAARAAGKWKYAHSAFYALPAMLQAGITAPDKIKALIKTVISAVKAAGKDDPRASSSALLALPEMLQAGITDPNKIGTLIQTVVGAAGKHSSSTINALPRAIEDIRNAGITDPDEIKALIQTVIRTAGKDALYDLPNLIEAIKRDTNQSADIINIVKKFLLFTKKLTGLKALRTLLFVIKRLKIAPSELSYESFPRAFIEKLNAYADKKELSENLAPWISVLINNIHDRQIDSFQKDSIRDYIAGNLSPVAAYQLIALGGPNLYTSSFQKIWRAQKITNLRAWLGKVDPKNRFVAQLILTLCIFNEAGIFKQHINLFIEKAVAILFNPDDIKKNGLLLTKALNILLPHANSAEKQVFAILLMQGYWSCNSGDQKNVLAYLIKLYAAELNDPSLAAIAKELPNAPKLSPPHPANQEGGWFKDKVLTAKLYFYKDETWFSKTRIFYLGKGFKIKKSTGEHTYILEKILSNGIALRLILTNASEDEDNRTDSLNDPSIDIIVHRGHSYHFSKTFPRVFSSTKGKLLIGGSCGSFRDMMSDEFQKAYGKGNFLIADQNTGEGDTNNRLLLSLMGEIAMGCKSWDKCFTEKLEGKGLVLPDDPAFLFAAWETLYLSSVQGHSK